MKEIIIPKGYKMVRENKNVRVQLLFRPQTKKYYANKARENGTSLNELINELLEKNMYSSNGWIPVENKLPKLGDPVLVNYRTGSTANLFRVAYLTKTTEGYRFTGADDVIAWMPLPTPYKGE